MGEKRVSDELAELRSLLRRLESGKLIMRRPDGQHVTKREIGVLKRENTYLENVLGGGRGT